MKISRQMIPGDGYDIPSVTITPPHPRGSAVVVHGYGGCKEEQAGLAWRIAEAGITAMAIDLRGHGEHALSLDEHVLDDLESAISFARKSGKVAAVGHSFGGRLVLCSSADYIVAISPALDNTYNSKTQTTLTKVKSYRVRESHPGAVFDLVGQLPVWKGFDSRPVSIVCGTRDVPDIFKTCTDLKAAGEDVYMIDQVMHSDSFLTGETICHVNKRLLEWFPNGSLFE